MLRRFKFKHSLSLVACLLMMCAAALGVNRSLFGLPDHGVSASTETGSAVPVVETSDRGCVVIHTASLGAQGGYGGAVPLDIYVQDGKVSDIKALPNDETPSFFEKAAPLLEQWRGLTPQEAVGMRPDAVSGATYSSEAIIANVHVGMAHYLADPDVYSSAAMSWKMWIALAVVLAACVLPLFVKNRIYSNIQLLANVAVLGFWCGQFLDYRVMIGFLSGGMSFPAALVAAVMLVAAFIYPLFGKNQHYCNHICPLGSAQILVAELCGYRLHIGRRTLKALDWFRKILWAALMLSLWADVMTDWMDLELFRAFLYDSAPVGIIVAAVIFVLLSAVVARPYCRFVCPTGSLFKRAENIG